MQAGSKARGVLRTVELIAEMADAYSTGKNNALPTRLPLKEHLSIERRPLIVIPPDHMCPMTLRLTLGNTLWLLRLSAEALSFYYGPEQGGLYATALAYHLGQSMGVSPAPYIGRALEGRLCQRFARRFEMVCALFARYVPEADSKEFSVASSTWRDILPMLTRGWRAALDLTSVPFGIILPASWTGFWGLSGGRR